MAQNSINNSSSSLDVDNINIDGNTISSTDTNGNIILTPDGTGEVTVSTSLSVDNINIDANTISSTDTNGNIILDPDGTGFVSIIGSVSADSLNVDNINIDANTISSTDTNGNVIIAPDGTGDLSITAASVVPSTDRVDSLGSATNSWNNLYANGVSFDDGTTVLDTYTENTAFVPNLAFGGGTTGITYSRQVGNYYLIGKLAFITLELILTSQGTDLGNATIENLPFNAAVDSFFAMRWSAINLTPAASRNIVGAVTAGTTSMMLQMCADNNPFIAATDLNIGATSGIFLSAVYPIQ